MTLLLLFTPSGAPPTITAPTVTVQAASGVGLTTATGNGNITDTGGENCTRRGFQYNAVAYPDKDVYADGSFGTGAFTLTLTGLTPGQTYWYRAYATNSAGTGFSGWTSFVATASTYNITINGIDRTADILAESIAIEDIINDKQNTCEFDLIDLSGNGFPSNDQEIIITMDDGTILFGGYIVNSELSSKSDTGQIVMSIVCVDYVRLFDRNLVSKTYENMTDKAIIEDIVNTYCPGFGITTVNVIKAITISQIAFNYLQPSECLRKLCEITGRNWYIDYSKDIHYFPLATNAAPFNITSTNNQYSNLKINKDASQIKNRIYVRGGTKLSDATYYEVKGDGTSKKFVIPDKPHNVTVKVNGVAKTVGIKNIDTSGYDWYLNYQEKYLEQDTGGSVLSTSDTLRIDYQYDIPILIAQENTASIAANGVHEFAIFDKTITTTQAARDRASAELTDYANKLIEGSFRTFEDGFISGQYININLSDYNINDNYIVQKVVAHAMGAGYYYYDVYIASAKTMGILLFLIELLEANKNLIEIDENEVVDELVGLTDSLLSDSITDSLTIDSSGPYFTWCTDSLQSSPITRARWDLFSWG